MPDLVNDPHFVARDNLILFDDLTTLANPLKLGGTPPTHRLPSPKLGEYTREVLRELGYTDD